MITLDQVLAALEARIRGLTKDERSLASAINLLADCRAIAAEGKPTTAMALAEHLSESIPAYFAPRSWAFNSRKAG